MNPLLKNIGVSLSTVMGAVIAIWFFAKASFNEKVESIVNEKINERAFILEEKERFNIFITDYSNSEIFRSKLTKFLNESNSSNVSIKTLLAESMGVPENKVIDVISDLYLEDSKRLKNVLRLLNNLYPEEKVWIID